MKTKHLFLFAGLLGAMCWACSDNEDPQVLTPTIELTAPADNSSVDLETIASISFAWKSIEGVTAYVLVLSNAQDMSSPQTIALASNPQNISANELDAKAAALGIAEGATAKIYWSVKSNAGEANTQTRALNVTRKATPVPTITLSAPDENATIDVNTSTFPVTFSWTKIPEVNDYTIKFTNGTETASEIIGDFGQRQYTDVNFDALLGQLGITINGQAVITWTVEPTVPNAEIVTQTRTFTGIRKAQPLVSPEDNTSIQLDDTRDAETAVTFAWAPQTGALKLVISKNNNLSDAIEIDVTGTSQAYTHGEMQAMLIANLEAKGLKRYFENTLYWNIKKADNSYVGETHGVFKLSGQRIFTDVRGDESITYKVAVITYLDDTKAVWLAENLRATYYTDGNKMGHWSGESGEIQADGEGPHATKMIYIAAPPKKGGTRTAFSGDPIPENVRANIGLLYNQALESFPLTIPVGWHIPTRAEFTALWDAAAAATGGTLVLLNPELYPDSADNPYLGEWGMNIGPSGRFLWNFWSWDHNGVDWTYNMDQTGETQATVGSMIWGNDVLNGRSWPYGTTGAATRVIYNGE
jgi:uncharacterized protein (TIGR02145 family)